MTAPPPAIRRAVGRGLGADLLALACADLAARGFATARLSTDSGNRADRFYRRHGWVPQGLNADGELRFKCALSPPTRRAGDPAETPANGMNASRKPL